MLLLNNYCSLKISAELHMLAKRAQADTQLRKIGYLSSISVHRAPLYSETQQLKDLGSIILTRQAMTVPQWTLTILIPGNVINSVANSTTQITWLMGDDDNQEERGVLVILAFIHMQMIMITKIVESPVGGGGGEVL